MLLWAGWAVVGLLTGRFINMIADEWPRGSPLALPPRCPRCGTARPPLQRFGLIAYLLGRTRCRQCGQSIHWRWPLVEALSAALFALLSMRFGLSATTVILTAYSAVLLLVCVIDFEHRLILNRIILPAIFAAFLLSFVTPNLTPAQASLGGIIGFLLTGVIYLGGVLYVQVQARRGHRINEVAFGQGDVMLMLFVGLITGAAGSLNALVLGIVFGGVVAAAFLAVGMLRRRSVRHFPFAYGPYLALGGWIVLLQNAVAHAN